MMQVQPVILSGRFVRLEPLSEAHVAELSEVGINEIIWKYMTYGEMRGEDDMRQWVRGLLLRASEGTECPFAVRHLASGRLAGATRYMDIRPEHHGLEIGGTWYGEDFQRTSVNTECKYLLLKHAFEELKCIRVQLKTDSRNERSQKAIERIGGKKEGILRNQMILPDGYIRSSVYYSILNTEWPGAKKRLEGMLNQ